jgi:hypothetical protein
MMGPLAQLREAIAVEELLVIIEHTGGAKPRSVDERAVIEQESGLFFPWFTKTNKLHANRLLLARCDFAVRA